MPSVSRAQRRTMGACEHGVPLAICDKIHMSPAQMHDLAASPERDLPERAPRRKPIIPRKRR